MTFSSAPNSERERDAQSVCVRVVYDGPPRAGKTTSVRALAQGFLQQVYTPEEFEGQTVYFDWVEHVGGRFDGAPIHFQIASVPGQTEWRDRRMYFVERADVVVFVGDTRTSAWAETLRKLAELRHALQARSGPAVGIVFQANRRDSPEAVSMATVRDALSDARVAVVESVAAEATGVREAFVFAVRLALDRVREARSSGARLPLGLDSAEQALAALMGTTAQQALMAAPALAVDAVDESPPVTGPEPVPHLPSEAVPSGLVWPPVEGRIVLRDAVLSGAPVVRATAGGYVADHVSGWSFHSDASATFRDMESARGELVSWARVHSACNELLSAGRCIVLADTGHGAVRLWQVVRNEPSLRSLFLDGVEPLDGPTIARLAVLAGRLLLDARIHCAAQGLALPCTLDTIGLSDSNRPVFVGRMPRSASAGTPSTDAHAVARELTVVLRERSASECNDVRTALQRTPPNLFGPSSALLILEALRDLLSA